MTLYVPFTDIAVRLILTGPSNPWWLTYAVALPLSAIIVWAIYAND